jgi:hypothetical protein
MQCYGKYLGPLLIVIRVTLVTSQVCILQRMQRHARVRSIFVTRSIITAMTGAAAFFARMDGVPLALLPYRMRRHMTGAARRAWIVALRSGSLWGKQHSQSNGQRHEGRDQQYLRCSWRRHVSLLLSGTRLPFRLGLPDSKVTFGWMIMLIGWTKYQDGLHLLCFLVPPAMRQARFEQQAVTRIQHISYGIDHVGKPSL